MFIPEPIRYYAHGCNYRAEPYTKYNLLVINNGLFRQCGSTKQILWQSFPIVSASPVLL